MRQMSLMAIGSPQVPAAIDELERFDLGAGAWVDTCPSWLPGAEGWFDEVRTTLTWRSARRPMYDRMVDVPRLMASVDRNDTGQTAKRIDRLATRFEQYYGEAFPTVHANWYRNGEDSVAWHADRVRRPGHSIVAILSLGERRPFLLRPAGGGRSMRWLLGDGDLIVLGGTIQAAWHHAVPKVAAAGERISIMIRSSSIAD